MQLAVWLGCARETQATLVVTDPDSLSTVSGTKTSIKSGQIGWEIGQFHVCYATTIRCRVFPLFSDQVGPYDGPGT